MCRQGEAQSELRVWPGPGALEGHVKKSRTVRVGGAVEAVELNLEEATGIGNSMITHDVRLRLEQARIRRPETVFRSSQSGRADERDTHRRSRMEISARFSITCGICRGTGTLLVSQASGGRRGLSLLFPR